MVYPLHGGADHYFSEALYLADPDGNRIEIYHDRQKFGVMRMETTIC